MASTHRAAGSTVPQLMTAVRQLRPDELREFKQRFAAWQKDRGEQIEDEKALVEACRLRLPPGAEGQLRTLIAKSESGVLRCAELENYRSLVERAESVDATRLAALIQRARLWGQPVRELMKTVGWEGPGDETTGHPAPRAMAGARARQQALRKERRIKGDLNGVPP